MKEITVWYLARILGLIILSVFLYMYAQENPELAIPIGIVILSVLFVVLILRWVFLVEKRVSLLYEISEQLKKLNKINDEIKGSLISINQRISPEPTNDKKDEMGVIKNIRVKCPNCPYFFNMPKEYLERKIKCPKCKQEFLAKKQLVL